MRIIDRYVFWSFIRNYLISFMVLIGMYIVLDMVFNFDDLTNLKGSVETTGVSSVLGTIRNIADYYFYQCFLFFVHLSGIIPVVAAAFTLMRLSRFNELTAMLAAGVPLLRIAMPIVLAGVVLNGLMIADQELVIPAMLPKLTRSHDDVHRSDVKSFPIQAMQDNARGLLYAGRYTPPVGGGPAVMDTVDVIERGEAGTAPGAGDTVVVDQPGGPIERQVAQSDGAQSGSPAPTTQPDTAAGSSHRPIEAQAHVSADRAIWNPAERRWDLMTWDPQKAKWLPYGFRVTGLSPDAPASSRETVAFYQSNITPEEIALYRSGDWVELLSTSRIDDLIARPGSYGQANLLRVKNWRFTQPIMNVILLLLAIPCVLTREPGHLKTAATKCLILTGLGMGSIFLCHQIAGNPPHDPAWTQTWPALMAWVPIMLFGPVAVFLLDRVKT
jgi:lipopolysaccharide export system permease protein